MVGLTIVKSMKRLENEVHQRSSRQGEIRSSQVNPSWMTELRTFSVSKRSDVVVGVWRLVNTINPGRRKRSSRYKKRFCGRLTARNEEAQRDEVLTACNILNKMTELGIPNSVALRG